VIQQGRCSSGYTGADLVADAVGVLDAYGVPAAHVVGVSAGGRSRSCSRPTYLAGCYRSS
jgi:pimeloyl-ACP methyl ester carboxylesterase